MDGRIELQKWEDNYEVKTIPYDSDHNAITAIIKDVTDMDLVLNKSEPRNRHNFKGTDWQHFQKHLAQNYRVEVPAEQNLTESEIDSYIQQLEEAIRYSMEKTIPKCKKTNSTDKYLNQQIKKLQKDKSFLLTLIHKEKYSMSKNNKLQLIILNRLLRQVKEKLRMEFATSISEYWKNKIKDITHKKADKMFPALNVLFRRKEQIEIHTLKIEENEDIIKQANIDIKDVIKDENKKYVITDTQQKLNVMGTHYESVCSQADKLGSPQLTTIVHEKVENIMREIKNDKANHTTLTNFNETNPAHAPRIEEIDKYNFTHIRELKKTLNRLSNKTSSGIDGIPNIVLKKLPMNVITDYTILFNNSINNMYFPTAWKTAKIIAILKKGKDKNIPASYRPICLLPCISKLYEYKINQQIVNHSTTRIIVF